VGIAAGTCSTAALLGIGVGVLYQRGYLGSSGYWVSALTLVAEIELHKISFATGLFAALYLAIWAAAAKLSRIHSLSRWLLVKGCLGLSGPAIFAFCAGFFIPPLEAARAPCLFIGLEGLVLAAFWAFSLS
jgi:hypothetical protein